MAQIHETLIPRDTSPAMAQKQFDLLMALPAERRLRMASEMFASARRILIADLEERKVPREKWPGEVFRRVYGGDFPSAARERIATRLDAVAARKT